MNLNSRRSVLVCVFAMISFMANSAWGKSDSSLMDPAVAKKLYAEVRPMYEAFERSHGGWIETRNGPMHYLHWNKAADGMTLVWAHGTYDSAYSLMPVIAELKKMGIEIIAIDYYGHGKTPIPPHEVSIYHVADDMATLLNSLDVDKAIVGGHSRGGTISSAFYDSYPKRVLGLILEDGGSSLTANIWDNKSDEELKKQFASFFDDSAAPKSFETEFDLFYENIKFNTEAVDPTALYSFFSRSSEGEDGRWIVNRGLAQWLHEDKSENMLPLIRESSNGPMFQYSTLSFNPMVAYRNLNVPVLIIEAVSVNDPYPTTDQNRRLQQLHPDLIEHQIWEQTGHFAHYQHPLRFTQEIASFLEHVQNQTDRDDFTHGSVE